MSGPSLKIKDRLLQYSKYSMSFKYCQGFMKKTFTVEETANLINKIQQLTRYSFQQIATQIGVSVAMISKWKNGRLPISEKNFLRLQTLAEGRLQIQQVGQPPPDLSAELSALKERVAKLEGYIEGLKASQQGFHSAEHKRQS